MQMLLEIANSWQDQKFSCNFINPKNSFFSFVEISENNYLQDLTGL